MDNIVLFPSPKARSCVVNYGRMNIGTGYWQQFINLDEFPFDWALSPLFKTGLLVRVFVNTSRMFSLRKIAASNLPGNWLCMAHNDESVPFIKYLSFLFFIQNFQTDHKTLSGRFKLLRKAPLKLGLFSGHPSKWSISFSAFFFYDVFFS